MYFPDSSNYSYAINRPLADVLTIGWLDKSHEFPRSKPDLACMEKLKRLHLRESVNPMRGYHYCHFCDIENVWVQPEEKRKVLGMSEIWVPDFTRNVIYAAPSLIIHYCEAHSYSPPSEFIEAVMAFDLSSSWSGEEEHRKRTGF